MKRLKRQLEEYRTSDRVRATLERMHHQSIRMKQSVEYRAECLRQVNWGGTGCRGDQWEQLWEAGPRGKAAERGRVSPAATTSPPHHLFPSISGPLSSLLSNYLLARRALSWQ